MGYIKHFGWLVGGDVQLPRFGLAFARVFAMKQNPNRRMANRHYVQKTHEGDL